MDEKVVSFFVASSIEDLAQDRKDIGAFISQLNNIYRPYNIYIEVRLCEGHDIDHSIGEGGSQSNLDQFICNSDLCFVIFFEKVGDVTLHEFELALDHYMRQNTPKVVVYFKRIPADHSIPDEIISVMKRIDDDLQHYHREYTHIDSLKLGIITQLQTLGFINLELNVENSTIMYNHQPMISVRDIPLFGDNEEYTSLYEEYLHAVSDCERLKASYAKNHSLLVRKRLNSAANKCDAIKKQLDDLTQSILDISQSIAQISNTRNKVNENIRKAIRCFDSGDYEGVLQLLDPEEIYHGFEEMDDMEEQIQQQREALIEECRLRIMALKAKGNWSEADSIYERVLIEVRNHPALSKNIVYEYAKFLFDQNNYEKCIEICFELEKMYSSETDTGFTDAMVDFFYLYGTVLYDLNHYEQAREILEATVNKLHQTGGSELQLAKYYVILGRLYDDLSTHTEAENMYMEALGVYERRKDEIQMACVYEYLAQLYYQMNLHSKADEMYEHALEIFSVQDKTYASKVADLCSRLAGLRCAIKRHKRIDRVFLEALHKRNNLMQKSGSSFYEYLGEICDTLARVYSDKGYSMYSNTFKEIANEIKTGQAPAIMIDANDLLETDFAYYATEPDYADLELYYQEALRIREEEAKSNLDAYELTVSRSYCDLGFLYMLYDRYEQAEAQFKKAQRIQENLVKTSGNYAKTWLAVTYCNHAELCSLSHRYEQADIFFKKALQIYKSFSLNGEGVFANETARTTCYLAKHYIASGKVEAGLECFYKAMLAYIELYRNSPTAFIDRVLNTMADIVHILTPDGDIMNAIL